MYSCIRVYILYTRVEKATALSLRAEACTDLGLAGETIRLPNLSQLQSLLNGLILPQH